MTRLMMPNDGPSYSVVSEVRWDCPHEKLPDVVMVLEGAFRSAPEDKIASALFRLRMLTRAREQRSEEMMEAEAVIWIEQLRTYPGDVVLDVLKSWTTRKNGQWWPTWHEVQDELQRRCDRRQALLNFVRQLAERPEDMAAITDQGPTPEQRAKVVAYWEEMRKTFGNPEVAKPGETAEEALARLEELKGQPLSLSPEALKKYSAELGRLA